MELPKITHCYGADTTPVITRNLNLLGCDSIRVQRFRWANPLIINMLPVQYDCNLTASDHDTLRIPNFLGCDSIWRITPRLPASNDTTRLYHTTCNPNQAGSVDSLFRNRYGCDSLVRHLTTLLRRASVTITGNPRYCIGSPSILTATAGFSRYLWSTGETTRTITATGTRLYTVTVTNHVGCDTTAQVQVTTDTLPSVFITGDTAFCSERGGRITATAGFVQYSWSTGETTASIQPTISNVYEVIVTDQRGCRSGVGIAITVHPRPIFHIVGNLFLCEGKFTELNIEPAFPQYQWSTGASANKIRVLNGNQYSVTVTSADGCQTAQTVNVSEHRLIRLPTRFDTICKGETDTFPSGRTAQIAGNYQDTVRWQPSLCDREIRDIRLHVKVQIPTRETIFVCDTLLEGRDTMLITQTQAGCPNIKIRERVFDIEHCFTQMKIHNGLIPDGDGQNEVFFIQNIERFPNNHLVIQDQRGMIVFETNRYRNQWSGTDANGNPLIAGEYEYAFVVKDLKKGKSYTRTGTIYLYYKP
jgi:gliding motility-associated-like protein